MTGNKQFPKTITNENVKTIKSALNLGIVKIKTVNNIEDNKKRISFTI